MTEDNGTPWRARGNKSARPSPARACLASTTDDAERIVEVAQLVAAAWDVLLAEVDEIERKYADAIAKSDDNDQAARTLELIRQRRYGKLDKKSRADFEVVLRTLIDGVTMRRTEQVAILADARKRGRSYDWLEACSSFSTAASLDAPSVRLFLHELCDIHEEALDLTPEDVREAWKLSKGKPVSLAGRLAKRCHVFGNKNYRTTRQIFASLRPEARRAPPTTEPSTE